MSKSLITSQIIRTSNRWFEALGNRNMNKALRELLDQVESVPDFSGIKLNQVNDTNSFGDNALHCVCVWGDIEAAKLLVENGINIEQQGEGGFTPLKVAQDFAKHELVKYLISIGANKEALNAEFQFDAEKNAQHINKLKEGVDELEKTIDSQCNKNS